jgi:hypothetical protein
MIVVGIQVDMFDEEEGDHTPMHKKRFSLAVSIIVNAIKEEANNMGSQNRKLMCMHFIKCII